MVKHRATGDEERDVLYECELRNQSKYVKVRILPQFMAVVNC